MLVIWGTVVIWETVVFVQARIFFQPESALRAYTLQRVTGAPVFPVNAQLQRARTGTLQLDPPHTALLARNIFTTGKVFALALIFQCWDYP